MGLISNPLRSRFGAIFRLDYYKLNDIEEIIQRSSRILEVKIEPEAIKIIASASRFTPRIANRLLKRSRDYAQVYGNGIITKDASEKTLESFEIDDLGLEPHDRRLLQVLIKKFNGGPVGLGTLAASLNEEKDTLEEVYEPFLMNLGFIQRTNQGRIATPAAYEYLKIPQKQKGLI
jgi:Holliday junction DNA helicase RuvB